MRSSFAEAVFQIDITSPHLPAFPKDRKREIAASHRQRPMLLAMTIYMRFGDRDDFWSMSGAKAFAQPFGGIRKMRRWANKPLWVSSLIRQAFCGPFMARNRAYLGARVTLLGLTRPLNLGSTIWWDRERALAGEGVRGLGGQGKPLAKGFPLPPRLISSALGFSAPRLGPTYIPRWRSNKDDVAQDGPPARAVRPRSK